MMNENTEIQLRQLYDELMERPNEIRRIFEDFFGEDKVDMQGYLTYEEFVEFLNVKPLKSYLTDITTLNLEREQRALVNSLWVGKNAGEHPILSDAGLISVFLPLIKSYVGAAWFKELFILVHFPHVKVTNEYDRSVDIYHLYAKVIFNWMGIGKGFFGLNRSEYNVVQFRDNYMHSHMYEIPKDDFTRFRSPCTGSGPINSTLATLATDYDEGIWQLFCLELDRYVRVESIEGVPYHRLENIGISGRGSSYDRFPMNSLVREYVSFELMFRDNVKDFLKYILEKQILSFNYINNQYGLAMSWIEYTIAISNAFIDWYNSSYKEGKVDKTYSYLIDSCILQEAIIKDGKVYLFNDSNSRREDLTRYQGKYICTFKGREVTLDIVGIEEDNADNNMVVLLSDHYTEIILGGILKVLNYNYGRKRSNTSEGTEETSATCKKKRYI